MDHSDCFKERESILLEWGVYLEDYHIEYVQKIVEMWALKYKSIREISF